MSNLVTADMPSADWDLEVNTHLMEGSLEKFKNGEEDHEDGVVHLWRFSRSWLQVHGWRLALTAIGGDGNSNFQRSYFQILATHRGVFPISPAAIWQYTSCVAMLNLTLG